MTETDFPSNAGHGFVTSHDITNVYDGTDADRYQDGAAVVGAVRFRPMIEKLVNRTGGPSILGIWTQTLTFYRDPQGFLIGPDGERGVWLIADDDPDYGWVNWGYQVQEALTFPPVTDTYYIHVPENTVTDLNDRGKRLLVPPVAIQVLDPIDESVAPFGLAPFGISPFGGVAA